MKEEDEILAKKGYTLHYREPTPEDLGLKLKKQPFRFSLFLKPKLELIDTLRHNDEDSYIFGSDFEGGHIDFICARDTVHKKGFHKKNEVYSNVMWFDKKHPVGITLRWKTKNGKWECADIGLSAEAARRLLDDLMLAYKNRLDKDYAKMFFGEEGAW